MHTQTTSTSNPPLQEPTERYGFTEAMFWDVYQHVISLVGGHSTGTIESPALPADAVCLTVNCGPDYYSVWLVDSWPVAASDELCMIHWCISYT
ncbi:hypothetical protein HRD68_00765 (plasmid) [Yersinia massiliensis]|uniref:hypothetical protein n=1 Tax=Yersinia massiliensis TaxID=419257 RepID=UPI001561B637|nr:hypothetical protein [Yersinia massiliensis]QKJ09391.1 hypothetical protein HRD68_00765 [Yersinia massiliensis]